MCLAVPNSFSLFSGDDLQCERVNSWSTPEAVVHTERWSGLAGKTYIENYVGQPPR
ncbi:Single-minded like 2, partial [Dissostichus eleginoides]